MRLRCRVSKVAVIACVGAGVLSGSALAAAPGIYFGQLYLNRPRQMDIAIKVLPGGRRADWQVDVSSPCPVGHTGIGAGFGTSAGSRPPDPQIVLHHGRFSISNHGSSPDAVHWSYTLTGHTVNQGFAGTVRYVERWTYNGRHVSCNSGTFYWRARRSRRKAI